MAVSRAEIEAIHRLTPTQEGMLLQALAAPEHGAYVQQLVLRLRDADSGESLRRGFERALARFAALRTAFVWQGLEQPIRAVRRRCALPVVQHDWCDLDEAAVARQFDEFLRDDRANAFDLTRAPLMRLHMIHSRDELRVVWTHHHLILDGWSIGLVLREVFATGEVAPPTDTRAAGMGPHLAWLAAQDEAAAEAYWRACLTGVGAATPAPLGPSARAGDEQDTYERCLELAPAMFAQLRDMCRRERVSLATALQASWALLLAWYADTRDVVFGSTSSGRPELAGMAEAVGMFVTTAPRRVRIDTDARVGALLRSIAGASAEASAHEWPGLARIQRWSEVAPPQPLVSSLLVIENYPIDPTLSRWLEGVDMHERTELPRTAVVTLGERPTLRLAAGVPTSAAMLDRTLGHWRALLEGLAASQSDTRVLALDPCTSEERAWLSEHRRVVRPITNSTAPALLDELATQHDDRLALWHEGRALSYRELRRWTGIVARELAQQGVGPERIVALLFRPSLEFVVAVLAVLRAGGTVMPLDPSHPSERHAQLLADAGATYLLHAPDVEQPPRHRAQPLPLAVDDPSASEAGWIARGLQPEHLAYVIYTSGTTGAPKGVMVEQRALVNHMHWMRRFFDAAPRGMRHMLLVSPGVDVAIYQICLPLLRGDALFLPQASTVLDPEQLCAYVREHRIDVVDSVPSLIRSLLDERSDTTPLELPYLCCGGDEVTSAVLRAIERRARIGKLVNYYGPTETCLNVSALMSADWTAWERLPIGRPCDNYEVHVLDAELRPVPPGFVGEIHVGGAGLARGYLGRPGLSADRFVPNPFAVGERMYRTGDLARWLPDGNLEFVGRRDRQVKIRGFRVEIGEVETALAGIVGVGQAIVDAGPAHDGELALVAFVTPRGGSPLDAASVRAALRARLPAAMVPAQLVVLDAMPLTSAGKVDRDALRELAVSTPRAARGPRPRSSTQVLLAGIWAELLGIEVPDLGANFFALGGHSLLAMRLGSRIRETFGCAVPLRDVLAASDLGSLAELVDAARGAPSLPALGRVREREALQPTSSAQRRFWLLDQLARGRGTYNIAAALALEGRLNLDALRRALAELVARHEALRTVLVVEASLAQRVLPHAHIELELLDVDAPDDAEARAAALARYAGQLAASPFDLTRAPPLRAVLLRCGSTAQLVIVLPHVAVDGVALDLLLRELVERYAAAVRDEPSPREAATCPQPVDIAAWEAGWRGGPVEHELLTRWTERLLPLPDPLELPHDRQPSEALAGRAHVHRRRLPCALWQQVSLMSARERCTPFMVTLAAFALCLRRLVDTPRFLVGVPVAGRERPELADSVACMVNTLALPFAPPLELGFSAYLAHLRGELLAALGDQALPFEALVESLAPRRRASSSPLIEVMFSLEQEGPRVLELPDLRVEILPLRSEQAKLELSLEIGVAAGDEACLTLELAADRFSPSFGERFNAIYEQLLAAALAEPERAMGTLPLLSDGERAALLASGRAAAPRQHSGMREHLRAIAEARPDALALVEGPRQIDHAELDRRVRVLADRLHAAGVVPGEVVALAAQRRIEWVVSLLALLELGAACFCVDLQDPPERLRGLLDELGVRTLLAPADAHAPARCHHLAWEHAGEPSRIARPAPPHTGAFVFATSGSTGRPKPVRVHAAAIAEYCFAAIDAYQLGPDDRSLLFSSLTFDACLEELLPTLLAGGAVVLRDDDMLVPHALMHACRERAISVLGLPTAYFRELSDALAAGLAPATSLRVVIVGGERLRLDTLQTWRRLDGGIALYNTYGPTEAAIVTTIARVDTCDPALLECHGVPIGRPRPGASVYVLDDALEPCPPGVVGELMIGGSCLAEGYVGRPGLTAARFIPDPFGPTGARLYRSGDRGRWLPDGQLEFVGRSDDQIKLRGHRVELGEIEAALARHPDLRDFALLVRDDMRGEPELIAYLVGERRDDAELFAHLDAHLPSFMRPRALIWLDALPRTSSGKLDRRALPEPSASLRAPSSPPRGREEQAIARIWAELLGHEVVGRDDDFFASGGHSLLALRLLARLREQLGIEIPLSTFFTTPSIAGLAAASEAGNAAPPRIARVERKQRGGAR